MKRFIVFLLSAAMLLCACACGSSESSPSGKPSIVTTVFPAYDFARQIVGDLADITLLIPPGTEIHSYEPTPQDVIRLEKCDLLIRNGGESEEWLDAMLEGSSAERTVVTMMDCVSLLTEELKEGMTGDEEEAPEPDEHVWTSPANAVKICRAVNAALCEISPENAGTFTAACDAYCAELSALDDEFRTVTASAKLKTLIFADRFPVRYFVEEYGIEYFAAFPGCADNAEPSAKTVAFLIDRVKQLGCPAVMYIEFSNQKMADMIVEDTGCEKLLFHSCHNVTAEDMNAGVTYLSLMKANLDSLREALG